MKSDWLSLTPSELIRTKISATCSSSARAQLDDLESEVAQVADPVDPLLQDVLLASSRSLASRLGQPLQEVADRRLVPGCPQHGDVRR